MSAKNDTAPLPACYHLHREVAEAAQNMEEIAAKAENMGEAEVAKRLRVAARLLRATLHALSGTVLERTRER